MRLRDRLRFYLGGGGVEGGGGLRGGGLRGGGHITSYRKKHE